jgi:hypothetical protein
VDLRQAVGEQAAKGSGERGATEQKGSAMRASGAAPGAHLKKMPTRVPSWAREYQQESM